MREEREGKRDGERARVRGLGGVKESGCAGGRLSTNGQDARISFFLCTQEMADWHALIESMKRSGKTDPLYVKQVEAQVGHELMSPG